jgi:hypothetical protein
MNHFLMEKANMAGSTKEHLLTRITAKGGDYAHHHFTQAQDGILKTFFDLVHEYDTLEDYYTICVLTLKQSMDVECRLYLNDQHGDLKLVRASDLDESFPVTAPSHIQVQHEIIDLDGSLFFPIYMGPLRTNEQVPVGILQVTPGQPLSEQEQFFISIYANRIGITLNDKVSACQNIQHIKFVQGLVTDIEHNVIIPNMYFRHLFKKLRHNIDVMGELKDAILSQQEDLGVADNKSCREIVAKVAALHDSFLSHHNELEKHHASSSLFIESLFRKDHFDRGELVLRPKKCFVEQEIIDPQLEHFANRFKHHNIVVRRPADMRDEEIALNVDIGLLAQVYANLFSNALKYASVSEGSVDNVKLVAYGREYVSDCFGEGRGGVKFNVFSTGPHLSPAEAQFVFDEGFRCDNAGFQSGKGHGLAFTRQVVEIHGGRVSYEPVAGGNNFCFYLPLAVDET